MEEELTAEEQAYFDNRGEAEEVETPPEAEPEAPEAEEPDEPPPLAAEAENEPEKAEDTPSEGSDKEEKSEDKTVPIHALHEARQTIKEQRETMLRLQEQMGQFQNLRHELDEFRKAQQPQVDPNKEFEEDPIGYLKREQDELRQMTEQERTQAQQQQRAAQQLQAFVDEVDRKKQEFIQQAPDYYDAYRHLQEQKVAEYQAIGMTDPQEIQQRLGIEAMALSQRALQSGKNPAEVVYELSKRYGYKRAQEQKPADTLQSQVDKLEKGQKASQTLSGTSSALEENPLNLANVSTMSDDDFDKLWGEYESAEKR